MGAKGGPAPQPWVQHQSRTLFLRVPSQDWAAVKHGSKTEFRTVKPTAIATFDSVEVPTPVVAYAVKPGGRHDSQLMVLTAAWREPLGAISPESLAAEGFPSLAVFRRYWMQRTHRRFQPLMIVNVFRLREFQEEDRAILGAQLLQRLYKEHL